MTKKACATPFEPCQCVLSDDELLAFVRVARRLRYPMGPIFLPLTFTGQRKSAVAEARWREFHPELVRRLRNRRADHGPIDRRRVPQAFKV